MEKSLKRVEDVQPACVLLSLYGRAKCAETALQKKPGTRDTSENSK